LKCFSDASPVLKSEGGCNFFICNEEEQSVVVQPYKQD